MTKSVITNYLRHIIIMKIAYCIQYNLLGVAGYDDDGNGYLMDYVFQIGGYRGGNVSIL